MTPEAARWFAERTWRAGNWSLPDLVELKARRGAAASVVIPVRDEAVPCGYGVELASLLDTYTSAGLDAIAQVDLGARAHRHQGVHDLGVMAAELLVVADQRRRQADGSPAAEPDRAVLSQYLRTSGARDRLPAGVAHLDGSARTIGAEGVWRLRGVPLSERPPAGSVQHAVPDRDLPGIRSC